MHLIVHTFYSNRDIFLRELISNSSDALDKRRYEDLKNANTENNYGINISLDRESKTLLLEDTGIGMSKDDLLSNLGMIARSGTKNFMKAMENKKDMSLIGQFGVGFYSVFLVAERVVVTTKKNNEDSYVWESDGSGEYIMKLGSKESVGTSIKLFIKEDALEYLEENKIRDIIKQQSEYITYPLNLLVSKTREVEIDEAENKDDLENENENEGDVKEVNEENDNNKLEKKTITESYEEWEKVNEQEPVWVKNSSDVSLEDYNNFYKNLSGDYDDFLIHKHFSVEGQIGVKGIVFIPKRAPFDLFQNSKNKNRMKLYVRRVFITDNCEELIDYMNL